MGEIVLDQVAGPGISSGVKTSPTIGNLSGALAKAQGEFHAVLKDLTATVKTKSGGEYKYQYADLGSVLEAIRKPLSENGLAVMQPVETSGEKVRVTTILSHESGEWISSSLVFTVEVNGNNPFIQSSGSAMTYGRRYGLSGLLSIATEADDGGNGAGNARPKPQQRQQTQQRRQSAQTQESKETTSQQTEPESFGKQAARVMHADYGCKDAYDYSILVGHIYNDPTIKWNEVKLDEDRMKHVVGLLKDACEARGVKAEKLLEDIKAELSQSNELQKSL